MDFGIDLGSIARPLISIGTAALGWHLFGPVGGAIGWGLGMGIGGALFPAEAESTAAQNLGPAQQLTPTSNLGGVVPVVKGSRRIAGNLIWYDFASQVGIESEGGQTNWQACYTSIYGGGSDSAPGTQYYISFAIGICIGPAMTERMYIGNSEFIFDLQYGTIYRINVGENVPVEYMNLSATEILNILKTNGATPITYPTPPYTLRYSMYYGTHTAADSLIVSSKGATVVPPYRNLHYIVFRDMPTSGMNVVPDISFEVKSYVDPQPCMMVAGETTKFAGTLSTNTNKTMVTSGGYLYSFYYSGSGNTLQKIRQTTMEIVDTIVFSDTTMSDVGTASIVMKDASTLSILARGAAPTSTAAYYIWEIDVATMTINGKYAAGWLTYGTDSKVYIFKSGVMHIFGRGTLNCRPIDGTYWTSAWQEVDADCDSTDITAWGPTGACPSATGSVKALAYYDGYYYTTTGDAYGWLAKMSVSDNDDFAMLYANARHIEIIGGYVYITNWGSGTNTLRKYTTGLVQVGSTVNLTYSAAMMRAYGSYIYVKTEVWGGTTQRIEKYNTDLVSQGSYEWDESDFGVFYLGGVGATHVLITGNYGIRKLLASNLTLICDYEETTYYHCGVIDGGYFYVYIDEVPGTYDLVRKFTIDPYGAVDYDVAPQDVSSDILTNEFYGCGLDTTILEVPNTALARQYAIDNDMLISVVFDQQQSVLDALQYIIQHHNGYVSYTNGQIAHLQLQIDDAEIEWETNEDVSDAFTDNSTAAKWVKVE